MLCTEEMGTLLSRYVDGELADKEKKSIETHLETCASCRDVLNLFQRNDNVLNNALVGEAFGAQTVDAVMTEIRRLEEPMVVAPAVDDDLPPAPVAMRQVIQVTKMWPFAAAAVLMLACVGGVLAMAKYGNLGGDQLALERLHQALVEQRESNDRVNRAVLDRVTELSQELKDKEVRDRIKGTKESTGVAYVNERAIVVQANFPTEKFSPFQVFRAKEIANGRYEPWSTMRIDLPTPYFKDTEVVPGVNYMYQVRAIFRGNQKGDQYVDSVPVVQMLPFSGGLNPRQSLRIRFIGAHPDLSLATFEVSRYVNETSVPHYYTVKPGEKIGDVQLIDGKEVDFSTRYTLHSVVEVNDVITDGKDILATRPSRQANFKADPKAKEPLAPSFALTLEREQYVPLPK